MRYLMLAVFLLCGIADAKPVPKTKPPPEVPMKKLPAVPDMARLLALSNWGTVSQEASDVFITGHSTWEATGRIRKDGTLLLAWTLLETGEVCPGVYRIDGKDLVGTWGYSANVTIEPDGTLSGNVRPDRIYKLPTVEPPIN